MQELEKILKEIDAHERWRIAPEEAIEILEEVKELDDTMYAYNPAYMNALDMAIEAIKEMIIVKKGGIE